MSTTTTWKFQFLPLEGKLPGRAFEQQTEDAINGLGLRVIEVEETVEEAVSKLGSLAEQAYALALSASSLAETCTSSVSNIDNRVTALETAMADITAIPVSDVEALF